MDATMQGKVAVVTGASSGIGRELARGFARHGATVIAVSRASGDGERVAEELRASTGNADIHFVPGDLSVLVGIREVAERVRGRARRIDVLANNAGAYFARRQGTADGYEATFALNHLAPFLLTHLLVEPLLEAQAARIVVTSSAASRAGRLRLEDPMMERGYNGWAAYCQSKLANLAFTTALARRLEGTEVRVNAFHPGFVNSGFGKGSTAMNVLVSGAARLFARTPERGADTGLYLALAPELAETSGAYFADRKPVTPKAPARDAATTERLWQVSEELVRLTDSEKRPLERARSTN